MPKHVGDPSPRSPSDVLVDRSYHTVVNSLSWSPHGCHRVYLVVLHTGTETYWEAIYDAVDVVRPTSWTQVVPRTVQRTEYQRIP